MWWTSVNHNLELLRALLQPKKIIYTWKRQTTRSKEYWLCITDANIQEDLTFWNTGGHLGNIFSCRNSIVSFSRLGSNIFYMTIMVLGWRMLFYVLTETANLQQNQGNFCSNLKSNLLIWSLCKVFVCLFVYMFIGMLWLANVNAFTKKIR